LAAHARQSGVDPLQHTLTTMHRRVSWGGALGQDGPEPEPEAVVAMAFAEKGLKGWMALAADELDVRTRRGQWWLPG
jgi:hypothetical protein